MLTDIEIRETLTFEISTSWWSSAELQSTPNVTHYRSRRHKCLSVLPISAIGFTIVETHPEAQQAAKIWVPSGWSRLVLCSGSPCTNHECDCWGIRPRRILLPYKTLCISGNCNPIPWMEMESEIVGMKTHSRKTIHNRSNRSSSRTLTLMSFVPRFS